jgi:hypothetical protein
MPDSIRSLCDYDVHIPIDDISGICYVSYIPAHLRGRLRRRAEGGAGSGVLRPRLVTAGPGRSGNPPARHYDLAARSSLHKSGGNAGDGSAAPDRKSPRWSAERRARPAGRAPRLSKRGSSRPTARQRKYCAFRRSARPSSGGWKREKQNPGAKTRRGNEEDCAV